MSEIIRYIWAGLPIVAGVSLGMLVLGWLISVVEEIDRKHPAATAIVALVFFVVILSALFGFLLIGD